MFFLPLYHNLTGAKCLVVGAGTTALRKLRWLVRAGAEIDVVATSVSDAVRDLERDGKITITVSPFHPAHVQPDHVLVVSATNDTATNKAVHAAALSHKALVNCVDDPTLCTFIFPSIVDRHPIVVAVSSMGYAPTLARVVRGWIEQRLPPNLGRLADLAQPLRAVVKRTIPTIEQRMRFWERLFRSSAAEQAMAGDVDAASSTAQQALDSRESEQGSVALVGAGPGDPELITLKGLRLIQQADVILYDKLANSELLNYARRDANLVDVGKRGPKPGSPPTRPDSRANQQQNINQLLIEHAQAGSNVVRLKGGDPFIYGRGGEELEAVLTAELDVIVVPGITAALGAASSAGIPLTYRNLSQSVRFVTGHRVENAVNLDWPELGRPDQTLVIYMGLVGLEPILAAMRKHGCEPERPAALIENATLAEQRVIVGNVANLASLARDARVDGPSVVIIGNVVALKGLPDA